MQNFWHGFEKRGSALLHAAELAGLGTLAVPSTEDLLNKNTTPEQKRKAKYEDIGLGILAVPSAYAAGKGTYEFGKKYGPKAVGLAKKYGPKLFKR